MFFLINTFILIGWNARISVFVGTFRKHISFYINIKLTKLASLALLYNKTGFGGRVEPHFHLEKFKTLKQSKNTY